MPTPASSRAFEHAGVRLGCKVNLQWVETSELNNENVAEALAGLHGIVVPGAFGTRGAEGKISCVHQARTTKLPCLGICYGFQMAVIEFARNVCGMAGANSTEIDTECRFPVINVLPEQKKIEGLGGTMRLGGFDANVSEGTAGLPACSGPHARMRFRHRYEVDPRYVERLNSEGLIFSGKSPRAEIYNILELPAVAAPLLHRYASAPRTDQPTAAPRTPCSSGWSTAALRQALPGLHGRTRLQPVGSLPGRRQPNRIDGPFASLAHDKANREPAQRQQVELFAREGKLHPATGGHQHQ